MIRIFLNMSSEHVQNFSKNGLKINELLKAFSRKFRNTIDWFKQTIKSRRNAQQRQLNGKYQYFIRLIYKVEGVSNSGYFSASRILTKNRYIAQRHLVKKNS